MLFSRTISQLSTESPSVLFLNLALLFCVALEPYLFYLLWNNSPVIVNLLEATSAAYAIDAGLMFTILATLGLVVIRQDTVGGKALYRNLKILRRDVIGRYAVGLAFLISAAPIFWNPVGNQHVRNFIWYASFVRFFIAHGNTISERIKRRKLT